jgi:NADH-quinone oxidoreductase subunit K
MEHGLMLAGVLFALGLLGLLVRRNVLFVLMSLEVMLNAAALAFIAAGSRWAAPDGQIMFVLIVTLAAGEAAVGLALVLQVYRRYVTLDLDSLSGMKG